MTLAPRSLIALVLAVLVASSAYAAPEKKPANPEKPDKPNKTTAAEKSADKPGDSSVAETIISEINFQGVKLEEVIEYLQDGIPNFKAVVIRDGPMSEDVPLVRMRLKKVALGQFMELLTTAYPGIEIPEIPGVGGPIYLIKVHATEAPQSQPGGALGNGGAAPTTSGVRVYALGQYIKYLVAARPEAPKEIAVANKEALNQILSLIKATLAQVGDSGSPQPAIQVHEETQTLIVKGTVEQQSVLEDVLGQLIPTQSDAERRRQAEADRVTSQLKDRERDMASTLSREKAHYQERLVDLEQMLDATRKQLAERDTMAARNAAELERLRVRLEAMERGKSGGNEPKPSTKSE